MPSRWEIPLPGVAPETIRWQHLHAAISSWFDDDAQQHHDKVKPYAITPPRSGRPHPAAEIGLLRDDLTPRILDRWAPGQRLRLGATVITSTTGPRLIAAASWEELRGGHLDRAWCLRFTTPVTFRRGNRFTPLPAPAPILGSLRRNWNTFAPAGNTVALDLAGDPVWVSAIDGHNEVVSINGREVSGFVGRLRLECDGPDPMTRAVGTVLRLAPFAGVGAYTTRCFGVTRIDPAWQPRPR